MQTPPGPHKQYYTVFEALRSRGEGCFLGVGASYNARGGFADFSQAALEAAGAGFGKRCSDTQDHALLCPSLSCAPGLSFRLSLMADSSVTCYKKKKMVEKSVAKNKLWDTHQMAVFNMDL